MILILDRILNIFFLVIINKHRKRLRFSVILVTTQIKRNFIIFPFQQTADILICIFLIKHKTGILISMAVIFFISGNPKFNQFFQNPIKIRILEHAVKFIGNIIIFLLHFFQKNTVCICLFPRTSRKFICHYINNIFYCFILQIYPIVLRHLFFPD